MERVVFARAAVERAETSTERELQRVEKLLIERAVEEEIHRIVEQQHDVRDELLQTETNVTIVRILAFGDSLDETGIRDDGERIAHEKDHDDRHERLRQSVFITQTFLFHRVDHRCGRRLRAVVASDQFGERVPIRLLHALDELDVEIEENENGQDLIEHEERVVVAILVGLKVFARVGDDAEALADVRAVARRILNEKGMRRARGRIECALGSDDFLHRVAEKSRKADERAEHENDADDDPGVERLAERARAQRVGGEQVTFDGQRQSDHDAHLTEVVGQRHVELRFEACENEEDVLVPNVVAANDGERRDADQGEHVSDGQAGQVRVGRLLEPALKENAQIEYVADDAEYTDGEDHVSIAGDLDVVQGVGVDGLISVEDAWILAHGGGVVGERRVLVCCSSVEREE